MRMLRYVLVGVLTLGLAIPGVALADDDGDSDSDRRRCSIIGTWFGVADDKSTLTGVMWTTIGKSENHGTNILEQLNNPDPSLGGLVPGAVRASSLRGNWHRVGNRKFLYTLTGYSVNELNQMVGIVRFKGDVTMYGRHCQFQFVTAKVDIYYPPKSPFADDPDVPDLPFFNQWGRRAYVELP